MIKHTEEKDSWTLLLRQKDDKIASMQDELEQKNSSLLDKMALCDKLQQKIDNLSQSITSKDKQLLEFAQLTEVLLSKITELEEYSIELIAA